MTDHLLAPVARVPEADYVFTFSYETYADASRRGMMRPPERLLNTLLASPRAHTVLAANPYRTWLTAWLRAAFDAPHRFRPTDRARAVGPIRTARADPTDLEALAVTYRRYEQALRRASERLGQQHPALVTMSPLVAGLCELEWTGDALYYGRDDWLSSPARRRYWPAYREAYRRIADSGRPVAAVSAQLMERIAPRGPHRVVPNGIEPTEWLGPVGPEPRWLRAIPRPRAMYVGTLDARLDVEGVRALARARPELQIVLVGPAPRPADIADLHGLPNVHLIARVSRSEIASALRHSDVSLLAHRRTALTEAMSPLKVYEYLAAGLPVLATDLAPVRGLGDRVWLTQEVAQFADVLPDALAAGSAPEADRAAFIADNSWASRHSQILELLRITT